MAILFTIIITTLGAAGVGVVVLLLSRGLRDEERLMLGQESEGSDEPFIARGWKKLRFSDTLTYNKKIGERQITLTVPANANLTRSSFRLVMRPPYRAASKLCFRFQPDHPLEFKANSAGQGRLALYPRDSDCLFLLEEKWLHFDAKTIHMLFFGPALLPLASSPPVTPRSLEADDESVRIDCEWSDPINDQSPEELDSWFDRLEATIEGLHDAYTWSEKTSPEIARALLEQPLYPEAIAHLTVIYASGMESKERQKYCGDLIMDATTTWALRRELLESLVNLPGGCDGFADRMWKASTPELRYELFHHNPHAFYNKLVRPEMQVEWFEEVLPIANLAQDQIKELLSLISPEVLASEDLSPQTRMLAVRLVSTRWLAKPQIALAKKMIQNLDGEELASIVEEFSVYEASGAPIIVAAALEAAEKFTTPEAKLRIVRAMQRYLKSHTGRYKTAKTRALLHSVLETSDEEDGCMLALTELEALGDKSSITHLSKIARDPHIMKELPEDALTRTISNLIERYGTDLDLEGQLSLANREQGGELTMSEEGGGISAVDP